MYLHCPSLTCQNLYWRGFVLRKLLSPALSMRVDFPKRESYRKISLGWLVPLFLLVVLSILLI